MFVKLRQIEDEGLRRRNEYDTESVRTRKTCGLTFQPLVDSQRRHERLSALSQISQHFLKSHRDMTVSKNIISTDHIQLYSLLPPCPKRDICCVSRFDTEHIDKTEPSKT